MVLLPVLIPAYEWPIVILGSIGIVVALRRRTLDGRCSSSGCSSAASPSSRGRPSGCRGSCSTRCCRCAARRYRRAGALASARRLLASRASRSSPSPRSGPCTRRSGSRTSARRTRASCSSRCRLRRRPGDPRRAHAARGAPDARERGAARPRVDSWGGTGWPWSWYLRDVPAGYYDMSRPEQVRSARSSSSPTRTTRRWSRG